MFVMAERLDKMILDFSDTFHVLVSLKSPIPTGFAGLVTPTFCGERFRIERWKATFEQPENQRPFF